MCHNLCQTQFNYQAHRYTVPNNARLTFFLNSKGVIDPDCVLLPAHMMMKYSWLPCKGLPDITAYFITLAVGVCADCSNIPQHAAHNGHMQDSEAFLFINQFLLFIILIIKTFSSLKFPVQK